MYTLQPSTMSLILYHTDSSVSAAYVTDVPDVAEIENNWNMSLQKQNSRICDVSVAY